MKKLAKIPQIRVKGFTQEWTEHLLNYYLETSQEKNFDGLYQREDVLSVSGDYGIVNQIEFQGRSFAGASVLNYSVVYTDDVVYTKSPLKENPYGIIKTNTGKAGIVSTLYAVYHPKEATYPEFVQWYFENNDRLNHYLNPLVNKGAKNDMKVSSDNALLGTVVFPDYAEQKAISDSFTHIKNIILQCESRLKKLQTLKTSMLEKMFPEDGANVPEIRFKEFDGAWERHKVGDFLTESRIIGHTGQDAKKLTVKLWGKGIVEKTDIFSGSVHTQYYIRKKGQFMYGKLDFLHAAFGIVPPHLDGYESTLDSPAFDLSNIDGQFLMNTVTQENFYLKNGIIANGSRKAKRIHVDTFLEMDILTPRIEEQVKIGGYFLQIDNLIVSVQQELDKLQSIKKALLEKMFV